MPYLGSSPARGLVGTANIDDSAITRSKLDLISTSSAPGATIKGDGTTDGYIQLNCSQNSHGIKLKSPAHSAGASYTLTFPTTDGNANEFLQTNGSGVTTWAGAGAFELIGKVVVSSGASSVEIESAAMTSSTYEAYRCFFTFQPGTNSASANVTLRNNGSYVTSYWGHGIRLTQGAQGYANYSDNAAHPLDGGTGMAAAANQHSWTIDVILHPTKYATIVSHGTHVQTGGTEQTTFLATWADADFAELDGIKVTPSSGTLSGGKLVVYGLKGS